MASMVLRQNNFLTLPLELLINVFTMLDPVSLKRLMGVSKYLRNFIFTQKKIFINNFLKMNPYENLIWSKVNNDFLLGLDIQIFTTCNIFEHVCNRNEVIILHPQHLPELKMIFIMLVHYYKINADTAAIDISRYNNQCAYIYYNIISKYPEIVHKYMEDLGNDVLWISNNYRDVNEVYREIDNAIAIGGNAADAFHTICLDDYDVYYHYLSFGVPSKDAKEFSYGGEQLLTNEMLIRYRDLIPIIGKIYGVYFQLDMNMVLDDILVHILSQLYTNNIEDINIAELIIDDYSEDFLQRVISMNHEERLQLI